MMKYWRIDDFEQALDKGYINYMMLNATISSGKASGSGDTPTGKPMSFFEFGEKLAGIK
jgi:hypothetical protein